MLRTYEGVLHNDRVEWRGAAPPRERAVRVHVTVLEDAEATSRGRRMAAALDRVAQRRAFGEINDPVAWQQHVRQDRPLPGREDEAA
jgi:hypothetical protein